MFELHDSDRVRDTCGPLSENFRFLSTEQTTSSESADSLCDYKSSDSSEKITDFNEIRTNVRNVESSSRYIVERDKYLSAERRKLLRKQLNLDEKRQQMFNDGRGSEIIEPSENSEAVRNSFSNERVRRWSSSENNEDLKLEDELRYHFRKKTWHQNIHQFWSVDNTEVNGNTKFFHDYYSNGNIKSNDLLCNTSNWLQKEKFAKFYKKPRLLMSQRLSFIRNKESCTNSTSSYHYQRSLSQSNLPCTEKLSLEENLCINNEEQMHKNDHYHSASEGLNTFNSDIQTPPFLNQYSDLNSSSINASVFDNSPEQIDSQGWPSWMEAAKSKANINCWSERVEARVKGFGIAEFQTKFQNFHDKIKSFQNVLTGRKEEPTKMEDVKKKDEKHIPNYNEEQKGSRLCNHDSTFSSPATSHSTLLESVPTISNYEDSEKSDHEMFSASTQKSLNKSCSLSFFQEESGIFSAGQYNIIIRGPFIPSSFDGKP